jgi:hypothetical protein
MRARSVHVVTAFGAALIALCVSARAQAADAPAPGLNWVRLAGAETCISAAALAQRVEARVGRVLFAPASGAALFVDGYVRAPGPSQWQVELAVSEADGRVLGRRSFDFTGADCSVIDEAVTLVIAVTLYPNTGLPDAGIPLDPGTAHNLDALFGVEPTDPDPSVLASAPAASVDAAAAAPPVRVEDSASRATGSAPATRRTVRLGIDLVGASGLGQLPGVAFGAGARIRIAIESAWPIELGVNGFVPTTEHASDGSAGQARFDLMLASLATCPWQPAWLSGLALCVGAEAGRLRVRPEAFEGSSIGATSDAVADLQGSAVLHVRLAGAVRMRAALTALLPLLQRSYTYQAPDGTSARLFRMTQIAGRAEIGVGAVF